VWDDAVVRAQVAFVLGVVVLSGCAAGGGGATSSPSNRPTPSPSDDFLSPAPSQPDKQATVTGTFGSDTIEGGCAYLKAADGTRYQVLYPDGWTLERNPFRLIGPDGKVAASGGETISVRGSIADDMASTCMIGPIFRATEVVSVD
jgi:hypothetical protein